ncbi:retrovirus-related pol polyprotein from transposon TNT 1-94 [Tanacetum coccineum]|uniref:Retrovirus-related pol polyprotein from transposon TNT 1-94 n=1 Tax=Tanacetum coccineum TaxID=301880 RepID=A0ABQ5CQ09_9ASTR
MFKLNIEPISHILKNNRDAHEDYLKKNIENNDTLRGLVECARKQDHSKPLLDSACRYTKHVQELLVYVSKTCPSSPKPSEKLVAVTPLNKDKKVKCSTGASGSKASGNKINNRISQSSSSNKTNKVEDQSRSVKSRKNKKNRVDKIECNTHIMQSMLNANSVSKPISNALVKHSVRNAKFKSNCVRISHKTSVARTPQQNGIVERQNRTLVEAARTMLIFSKAPARLIIEIIHVDFDKLTAMASEQFSSGPKPQVLTPRTISSGLMQNISSSTPYVPPTKNDGETLFQPMFDEYLNPPRCVDSQVPAVNASEPDISTGIPSSTTIDQDAPLTSTSQTTPETPSPVIPLGVEEANHDIKVAHMDNNSSFDIPIPEPSFKESSS